jgi:hypothetical protein
MLLVFIRRKIEQYFYDDLRAWNIEQISKFYSGNETFIEL